MKNKYLTELSRRLSVDGIQSAIKEDRRLDVFLHDRPVLYVSPASDVFLLPDGSQNEEASELYHQVAVTADEVYGYVEAMEKALPLRASGLHEDFRLLADFGGAVLAGQERGNGLGYTNKMIDMFAAGHTVLVELLCENRFMKTIVDDYGEAVPTHPYDCEHFVAQIEVNPSGTFYGWVFKFMGGVKIIAPQKCVEEMARIARIFL